MAIVLPFRRPRKLKAKRGQRSKPSVHVGQTWKKIGTAQLWMVEFVEIIRYDPQIELIVGDGMIRKITIRECGTSNEMTISELALQYSGYELVLNPPLVPD